MLEKGTGSFLVAHSYIPSERYPFWEKVSVPAKGSSRLEKGTGTFFQYFSKKVSYLEYAGFKKEPVSCVLLDWKRGQAPFFSIFSRVWNMRALKRSQSPFPC